MQAFIVACTVGEQARIQQMVRKLTAKRKENEISFSKVQ
jgi:hypothetical protein